MIPRLIHQTWKTPEVPLRFAEFQQSWRKYHSSWDYRLWTDDDNRRLIEENYPQFADFYRRLPYPILRVEFVKLAYLHRFGGLYVDLDFEARKPLDPLLDGNQIVLGRETGGMGHWLRGRDYILNALIASTAGNPLWLELMDRVVARFRPKRAWQIYEVYIIQAVIELLDNLIEERRSASSGIVVHPYHVLYPTSQAERNVESRRRVAERYDSYAIHHYDDSWFSPSLKMLTNMRYGWICMERRLARIVGRSDNPTSLPGPTVRGHR